VKSVTSFCGFEDVMANLLSLLTLHLPNSEDEVAQSEGVDLSCEPIQVEMVAEWDF
jgi:hypothetical protein